MNLSKYNNVFCDSKEALNWAYQHGLHENSLIRSSSPAMLWKSNPNIQHVEARWNVAELKKFQSSIQKFSEDIFDAALSVDGIGREKALVVAQVAVAFQKTLYKAACLEEKDFIEPRLFIQVEGGGGPSGNNMNSPWGAILSQNILFGTVKYMLKNENWSTLNTNGVSYWKRYKLAGIETLIYRVLILIMKYIPSYFFKSELLIPNENELIIEATSSLMLQGVKVTELNTGYAKKDAELNDCYNELYSVVSIVMKKRVEQWTVELAVKPTMLLFENAMIKRFKLFDQLVQGWKRPLARNSKIKQAVLMNASGNIKGQTLAYVCNKKHIPFISVQHGVTVEISKMHGEVSAGFDNSVADIALYYNSMCKKVESKSYFSKSKGFVVGASSRHIRMKKDKLFEKSLAPIVYVSTNLYRGNLGYLISWHTDYDRAKGESNLVTKVLSNLPHKVLYKTYPEDNRRYSDKDPVLNDVKNSNNIILFDKKVDMRYLLSKYRIIVTSGATSTLAWPVMSGKPVVFINRKEKSPLTDEAYICLSKGLFIFNDDEEDFHKNLSKFLSQPISDIEILWNKKKDFRKDMIKNYFSKYEGMAGKRAAKIILKECLT